VKSDEDRAAIRERKRLERERIREEAKKKRLAGALRANLSRRKAQSRAKRDGEEDSRAEGLPAARSPDER
jgi:hypothetical protein